MVHTFSCLGRRFAVDTESGSLFEVSELGQKIIERKNSLAPKAAGEFSRTAHYTQADIQEAQREVDALIRESVLFSRAPLSEPPEFDGRIKSVCLNVSHRCNLKCSYCFADGYLENAQDMGIQTAQAAIDYLLAKSGNLVNLEVDFFGGEPLLNFDVVKQTVAYARSKEKKHGKKFLFTVTTNAMLLDEAAAEYLNREADNVVLSIDGREEVHNSVRGANTFKTALANAKNFCEKRGVQQYFIRGTFTAKNPDFAQDVLALFDYGFKNVSVEPVVLPPNHPLAVKEDMLQQLCAEYESLAKQYVQRRASGDYVNFFHFNLDIYNGPCEHKRIRSCGAGCAYIAVTPDGAVYPCHRFIGEPAYQIGDVTKNRYDKQVPLLFSRNNHVRAKKECTQCWAKYYCSGGCAASSVKLYGNLTQPDTLSCTLMKKRIECALAVYAIEND
ncbi:MAG: thioether cross-link-forming SCIFF peptide maturase [Firmicutes bacterium]|nr:thioether cross-link-forming SCIFF peptide maturase [Bacillota bacterium]